MALDVFCPFSNGVQSRGIGKRNLQAFFFLMLVVEMDIDLCLVRFFGFGFILKNE